ncbi:MAG TPA: Glu/Leu/Phe/Val dehydrogenase dimerization domain-containing protein, partial [Vicinamibacteria bacterium]|nr:Glu/Leu/Phe/Val dehydrogenase dimerization domain-containing protein [Vicinamibacteria bacterium]
MTTALSAAERWGHEEVVLLRDPASGLRGVIAIHDTTLGPAVGGTRMRPYPSLDAAVMDALRLSRAMTYKAVMAGVDRGGGKAVIIGDPARDKSRPLLAAYARAVNRLDGRFHTGCDMGIEPRDVSVLSRLTKHVSHTPRDAVLDTAALAALGVTESIQAAANRLGLSMRGLRVAVQGVGQVGSRVARRLAGEGARLVVCDPDASRVDRLRAELAA